MVVVHFLVTNEAAVVKRNLSDSKQNAIQTKGHNLGRPYGVILHPIKNDPKKNHNHHNHKSFNHNKS